MFNTLFKKSLPNDFQNILRRADILAEQGNTEGLKDLIKLIMRPIQARHMLDAYKKDDKQAICEIGLDTSLGFRCFINAKVDGHFIHNRTLIDWLHSDDCKIKGNKPLLSLASDTILPTPWDPLSIIANLGQIGHNRLKGQFKQATKHSITYIYPLMIGLVNSGNHSIMQGILDGYGEITPSDVYDISCLLDAVYFDGTNWISHHGGEEIGKPPYVEFGWIWEIAKRYVNAKSKLEHCS